MTNTVHVAVGWNDDYDQPFIYEDSGGRDGDPGVFDADVPADAWRAYQEASAHVVTLERALIKSAGYDVDRCRMKVRCPRWVGEETPARRPWFAVVLSASDGSEWPVQDATISPHVTTEIEAEAALAVLPPEFWLTAGGQMVRVTKDRLSVVRHEGYRGSTPACDRCGWERDDHATTEAR